MLLGCNIGIQHEAIGFIYCSVYYNVLVLVLVPITLQIREPAPVRNSSDMSVTLHTDAGDIKVEVFCEAVPKAAKVSGTVTVWSCNY
jgi:hypothetical protein